MMSRRVPYMPCNTGLAMVAPVCTMLIPLICSRVEAKELPRFFCTSAAESVCVAVLLEWTMRPVCTTASLSRLVRALSATRRGR